MSRRALSEIGPLVLLSVAAALAFYYLRWTTVPELYQIPVKGTAVALLALYAWARHSSPDARLLTWALGAAALGDMAMEVDRTIGGSLFFLFHVLAMGVFLRHRRAPLKGLNSWVVGLTLILTPFAAWLLTASWDVVFYAAALGAMAASALASTFPRYRVGGGALLFVLSDLLIFAEMGPLEGHFLPRYMVWPTYYLGMLLIATGVVQTLRKRDPELRVVR